MPSRPPRPPSFPAEILSDEFVQQHQLVFRLYVGPFMTLTQPHGWAPMTDEEWYFLQRLLPPGHDQGLAGRPVSGDIWATPATPDPARARLDQIFRAVMLKRQMKRGPGRATWGDAATEKGPKPETIRRAFRRLAEAGFFHRLLRAVADLTRKGGRGRSIHARPGSFLLGLRYRACCAFRRIGVKRLGMSGLALARRLALFAALPAHSPQLPDRDLSAIYVPAIRKVVTKLLALPVVDAEGNSWCPPAGFWNSVASLHRSCGGLARIRRDMEPA